MTRHLPTVELTQSPLGTTRYATATSIKEHLNSAMSTALPTMTSGEIDYTQLVSDDESD